MKPLFIFTKQHPVLILLFVAAICLPIYAALDSTYDISTPASSDNPRDADDRMREIKAAIQERMNDHNGTADEGDHYWPLSGSQVSDVDTGQHRMVTLRQLTDNPSTLTSYSTTTDLGFLFQKDVSGNGELFWQDEADNVLQISLDGLFNLNSGYWNGVFATTTIDGSDNASITMTSGGAYGVGRGAGIILYGNEYGSGLSGKLVLLSGYSTGTTKAVISASSGKISDVADPENAQDAVTLNYLESVAGFGTLDLLATVTTTVTSGNTNVDVDSTQATTDGILVCVIDSTDTGATGAYAFGYTDASNPPTTRLGTDYLYNYSDRLVKHYGGYSMPVKKDEYYKCTWYQYYGDSRPATRKYYWRPIGS